MLNIQCIDPKELENTINKAEKLPVHHKIDSFLLKCDVGLKKTKLLVNCSIEKKPDGIFVISVTECKNGTENIYALTAGDVFQLLAQLRWVVNRSVKFLLWS